MCAARLLYTVFMHSIEAPSPLIASPFTTMRGCLPLPDFQQVDPIIQERVTARTNDDSGIDRRLMHIHSIDGQVSQCSHR